MTDYTQIRWVDDYVRNVAPFIQVREQDHLLIKIPNEAYKLNPQGLKVLRQLLAGKSVIALVEQYPNRLQVANDLHHFFCDLRAVLKGCWQEGSGRRAIEAVPFSLPFNTLPVLSEIAVTYRCNLACRFCYAGCGCSKKDQGTELTTDELKVILRMIREEAEVPSVSFTGGEPLLRPDLPELVGYAKSLNLWTNLITNGTLITQEKARALKAAGLDSAQVSLEGADASTHDPIVQQPGAFAQTLAGLEHLRQADIRVHTNTTISGLNRHDLARIVDLVQDLGLTKLSMNLLMPEGSAKTDLAQLLVSYSEIGAIVLALAEHAKNRGVEFMWYSPTPMCIFNPVAHGLGNKGCAACDGLLSIAANGDILPCSSYPKPLANMLAIQGKFKEQWRSTEFKYFQEKRFAHAQCQKCQHLAVCNGGCPLYWQAVGQQELLDHQPTGVPS